MLYLLHPTWPNPHLRRSPFFDNISHDSGLLRTSICRLPSAFAPSSEDSSTSALDARESVSFIVVQVWLWWVNMKGRIAIRSVSTLTNGGDTIPSNLINASYEILCKLSQAQLTDTSERKLVKHYACNTLAKQFRQQYRTLSATQDFPSTRKV